MGVALGKMIQEDPSFHVETDEDSGETILKGMGELHLDIKVDILRRTHGVDVIVGKPQVAYRETITRTVEDEYTHKKQSGGSGQYGKINYIIEPGEPGSGFVFESKVTGGNVPREYWPAVEKGFKSMLDKGVLAGFPCLDFKVMLMDGGFHAVDSSAIAFEIAAKAAFRQSIPKAAPQLIEPIMAVDTFTPSDHVGDVIGDLNRRRGMIKSQDAGATGVRIKSEVPLSEMFGYIGDLRTMTSGRGQFSMEFSHYLPCPKNVADEVIKEVAERNKAKEKNSFHCFKAKGASYKNVACAFLIFRKYKLNRLQIRYNSHSFFNLIFRSLKFMAIERTFSIIKPDAVAKNVIGEIYSRFEKNDLKIVAAKMVHLTKDQAEGFYAEHSERGFFGDLVSFMISGPVMMQVLEGENAVLKHRDILGATNPKEAAAGNNPR